ncbi:uncharacterized protein LOC125759444 [Rhipicephalus sanguineus]|uniref:uncharacterized protein LOC125759444 n=1 Tax=Rhipicephalus sanguineus TaxID=34632 RepID=UPI0020C24E16|nr:uncharacterized protein LOC125759444 [Rhipicephalus sanguineus]
MRSMELNDQLLAVQRAREIAERLQLQAPSWDLEELFQHFFKEEEEIIRKEQEEEAKRDRERLEHQKREEQRERERIAEREKSEAREAEMERERERMEEKLRKVEEEQARDRERTAKAESETEELKKKMADMEKDVEGRRRAESTELIMKAVQCGVKSACDLATTAMTVGSALAREIRKKKRNKSDNRRSPSESEEGDE